MRRRIRAGWLPLMLLCCSAVPASAQGTADLEAGIRAYREEGDAREAIRRIGDSLDAGMVSATDRPRAHVYMAHAFLALGDTASALPHIQRAIAVAPCVMPTAELAPPAWIQLYERSRPAGVACERRALGMTLRSMIVPGWGQRSVGRRTPASAFLFATAGAAAGAGYFLHRADSRYSAYEASTSYPELVTLYDQAESARRTGMALAGAAAGLYLWNVVDAAFAGLAHDRALARTRPLAALPVVQPTARGVSVALQIPSR